MDNGYFMINTDRKFRKRITLYPGSDILPHSLRDYLEILNTDKVTILSMKCIFKYDDKIETVTIEKATYIDFVYTLDIPPRDDVPTEVVFDFICSKEWWAKFISEMEKYFENKTTQEKGCYVIFTPTHCLHSDGWPVDNIVRELEAISRCGIDKVEYHVSLDISDEKMLQVYREIDQEFGISRTEEEYMQIVKSVYNEKKLYRVVED